MRALSRIALALTVSCTVGFLLAPAAVADDDDAKGGLGDDNIVVVENRTDLSSVADGSVEIRFDHDGVVDERNVAQAVANCIDCNTAAIALQGVVVEAPPQVVTPRNEATAANVACTTCLTGAFATQVVLQTDGPARLSAEGRQRLNELRESIRELDRPLASMSAGQLAAFANAAEQELIGILVDELVDSGNPHDDSAARRQAVDGRVDRKSAAPANQGATEPAPAPAPEMN